MALSPEALSLIGLTDDKRWNGHAEVGSPVVITYSFGSDEADYFAGTYTGYQGYSEAHKAHVRAAMDTWAEAAGITFVEVPDSSLGDIRFSMVDMTGLVNAEGNPLSGFGYHPGTFGNPIGVTDSGFSYHGSYHGDIFLNADYYAADASTLAPGIRGYSIVLHEIGHALGFKHPFSGTPVIPDYNDNGSVTVMSYDRSHSTTELGWADLEALTYLYGDNSASLDASWNARKKALIIDGTRGNDDIDGGDHKNVISMGRGHDQVIGAAGNDKIKGERGPNRPHRISSGIRPAAFYPKR